MTIKVNEETASLSPTVGVEKVCAQCESNARWNEAGGYKESAAECRAYCLRGHKPNPITQPAASASAPTTTVTDHSPASPSVSSSSISSVLTEIQERQTTRFPESAIAGSYVDDIDRLLSIIDRELYTETGDYTILAKNIADHAASNMKAAIVERVRERAAEIENAYDARDGIDSIPVGAAAQLKRLATELEAIETEGDQP